MIHQLSKLSYEYNALEPHIDAQTMEIHYSKHHQAYVTNLNTVLAKYPKLADRELVDIITNIKSLEMDEKDRTMLQNNGGGHLNHSFFWEIMAPKKAVDEKLTSRIEKKFGSVDEFKTVFTQAATTRFGSGWAWLVEDASKELSVYSTANQDSPLMMGHTPLIGLDVWEHAYYLKYQNRRPDYIKSWWNVLKVV